MAFSLMRSKRFAPLFWTQFFAAFNDNFLKNALIFLILFQVSDAGRTAGDSAALITMAGSILIVPFLFLSALGGEMADRYDKAMIARRLKLAEIVAAGLSVTGMALESIPILFAALFAFGAGSALFSPLKYGILPDHIEPNELPRANAWVEAGTFLSVLGGTIAAGLLFATGAPVMLFGPVMMALAVVCYLCSTRIPETGSRSPDLKVDWNILRSSWRVMASLAGESRLWRAAVMNCWFWLMGALVLSVLPVIVKDVLGGTESAVTYFLTVFAVSVGIGSAIAAWFSAGRVVLLPVPVGTFLVALFCIDMYFTLGGVPAPTAATSLLDFVSRPEVIRLSIDMAGLAIAGNFLVIPTFTALQSWSKPEFRARTIAGASAMSAGFIAIGSVVLAILQSYGLTPAGVFLVLAGLNVLAAIAMFHFLPTNAFRDFVTIVYRAFFRMEVEGMENLEKAGPAPILALNHVSLLDAGLALTLTDKAPVFAIDYQVAKAWWVRPFLRLARAMPLNPTKPMATRTLIKVVEGGDPLVIFPEGRLTVTGSLMKVYDGAAMVADHTGAPIVPIRIEGLERTPFSYLTGSQVRKSLFPKVKVTIMEPRTLKLEDSLKGRTRRTAAGAALYDVMSDLIFASGLDKDATIVEKVIEAGNRYGMKQTAIEDPVSGSLTYSRVLVGTAVLARKLSQMAIPGDAIGVMLPNANGTIVTMLATMSAGRVPAMINFTAGAANILSGCRAAGVSVILTSRAFIEKAELEAVVSELQKSVEIVFMEDVRQGIGLFDKIRGWLGRNRPLVRMKGDDRAAILFTSGSEGKPKGVVLTHTNILANAAQAAARIDFNTTDKVFNVLPVFHCFGLTAGTILPLTSGVPTYLYPSPLHYRIVPELVYTSNATIIFGTDTFLNGYARVAHAYDFRSIRYCFAGAEPVKPSTRETYMNLFGIRILEGYGVTETAPVIAINTPMFNKPGSVGRILPGIEARLEPVPGVDEGGRLFISGPNVMAGYLREEKPLELEPPAEGWHDTGDIVSIDKDGFVTILGRAKRFAKIAGEMVSLAAVESLADEIWPGHLSAVAAVKDERKGERLILLTDSPDATRAAYVEAARERGAQDLMVPAEVRVVGEVPLLATGKIDFVAVNRLAAGETPQRAA